MPESHPHALPAGHRLEEYEIVRVLGAGGFGITYLAFDHQLDGPVAIKEYFPAEVAVRADGWRVAASSADRREVFAWGLDRFTEEARSIHRFRHPNVVRVHRYVERAGTAYIVMEYVEGESLQRVLDARGPLPAAAWHRWLDPLLDGLAHVHGQGYLHRDLKPANIVIRAVDGEPVLIDFGAARAAAQERTHTRVLTPEYAPIEQHGSQGAQGPSTDIYALAAVSYRALTGAPPPSAPDRVLEDRYEPLSDRATGPDRAWLAAIDQGLSLRPADRPQTVAAWRGALIPAHNESAEANARAGRGLNDDHPAAHNPPTAPAPERIADTASPAPDVKAASKSRARTWSGMLFVAAACTALVIWLSAPHGSAPGESSNDAPPVATSAPMDPETVAELREAAERGDVLARRQLRQEANRGNVNAQFALAVMYDLGAGWPEDDALAVDWYRRAADQGHAEAQYNVAVAYAFGEGVPDDDVTAAMWFRMAAEQGHARAQLFLGSMYDEGVGVPGDAVLAHMWVTIAGSNGATRAREARERIEAGLTSAQIAAAGRLGCRDSQHIPSSLCSTRFSRLSSTNAQDVPGDGWSRRSVRKTSKDVGSRPPSRG